MLNLFQIYSTGYVLFNEYDFFIRDTPISSASDWEFSYISPFWTQTTFNSVINFFLNIK